MRKVLVCGGREYLDQSRVFRTLDALHRDTHIGCVISGGARGADHLGEAWAKHNRVALMQFPANWDRMGDGAGKVRNLWMLQFGQPDLVVAFPGGPGTADMMQKARRAGVEVRRIFE